MKTIGYNNLYYNRIIVNLTTNCNEIK
jgi:hypothetical protein